MFNFHNVQTIYFKSTCRLGCILNKRSKIPRMLTTTCMKLNFYICNLRNSEIIENRKSTLYVCGSGSITSVGEERANLSAGVFL